MADLSMVDIEQVLYFAVRSGSTRLKRTASTRGGNLCGACPKCYGTDRFYLLPEADGADGKRRGKWACRNCHPKEGDAIELLTYLDGISDAEAFTRLKEMYPELPTRSGAPEAAGRQVKQYRVKPIPETASPPSLQWQTRARQLIELAHKNLMSAPGAEALDYLISTRGLSKETIERARLGYIPLDRDGKEIADKASRWGITDRETVYIASGILFPYEYGSDVWKLRIRRLGDVEKDRRYTVIVGSANGLYRADTLRPGAPAIMVEGEIDALSIAQEVQDEIAVVALGGLPGARIPLWLMRLALCSWLGLCLDNEETEAIANARAYWTERLSSAWTLRYPEAWHDANDMLRGGADICAWLIEAMDALDLCWTGRAEAAPVAQNGAFWHSLADAEASAPESTSGVEGIDSQEAMPEAEKGRKRQTLPETERAPFTSYGQFTSHVQAMASALTERTGAIWTATPLASVQALDDLRARQVEAETEAALEKRRQLFNAINRPGAGRRAS